MAVGQEDVHIWGADRDYRTASGKKIKVMPIQDPKLSGEFLWQYAVEYSLDFLIGHWDVWVLGLMKAARRPFALYIPIDAPLNKKWVGYMDGAKKVIAYSLFGLMELEKWLPPSQIAYIPHGVDCETFRPLEKSKAELRRKWHRRLNSPIPEGAFLMANVQANVGPRKQIPLLLKTFRLFASKHKDAHLYLHTNPYSESPNGYNLVALCEQFGIEDRVHYPMVTPILQQSTDAELNEVFNAADVYVTNSLAEGFGLPVLEAEAAGTPVIAPRNSSHPELVAKTGYLFESVPADVYTDWPVYVPTLQENPVPDQRSLLEKMEEAYADRETLKKKGKQSREFALGYDWPVLMPKWFGLLEEFEDELAMFRDVRKYLEVGPAREG